MTTLVVPGLNDGEAELRDIARFLADVDRDIPWHISRFHPDYEYREAVPTPIETLRRAADIGREKRSPFHLHGEHLGGNRADALSPLPDDAHPPARVR